MTSFRAEDLLNPTSDAAWVLDECGFDPVRESSRESRFSISNGFLGVRGARAINRGGSPSSSPRTYVAGLFDIIGTEQPAPGLVSAADWLKVSLSIPGGRLIHPTGVNTSDRRWIDFRRGLVLDESCRRDPGGMSARMRMLRLVSLSDRRLGLQVVELTCQTGESQITLTASIDGIHAGLDLHRSEPTIAVWRTRDTDTMLAMACAPQLTVDDVLQTPTAANELTWSWTWTSRPDQMVCFSRLVAVNISHSSNDPGPLAVQYLAAATQIGWRGVLAAHEAAWAQRWENSDVVVDGDPQAQRALRFALYHLNSAADPTDDRVSIGARALTGEAYRGHVFWDTEIFLLPFFTMTWPEAARALLHYRFRTLGAARAKAARLGWRGALYAWESADTGDDVTPQEVIGPDRQVVKVLCGTEEQHISADVAYAVWQYWSATGDETFLLGEAAEIIIETARFWCSRARLEADGGRHIRGVIGPDEYHEHVDDSAYTNVMARWNICCAVTVASLLGTRWPQQWSSLCERLQIEAGEIAGWPAIADSLVTGFDPATELFEQFSGFFALERIDLASYAGRSVPMDVVLGRERTARSQVVKQADVVALLALLPDEFPAGAAEANYRFYEPLCSHGSSLSPAVHGLCAARLGDADMALRYLRQASAIDLCETHVAIDGGLHIAALGGIWWMTVLGFACLTLHGEGVSFNPKLPTAWRRLAFPLRWRGRHLRVVIERDALNATLLSGEPMSIGAFGQMHALDTTTALTIVPACRPDGR
jgi:trehalose/maltose hydrolase-like predicted phosphorylase